MVDAKYGRARGRGGSGADAGDLGSKEARRHAGHDRIRGKAVDVRNGGADGIAGDFRANPLDRIGDRGVAEDAEVERLVRVLPDVLAINDQVLSKSLLETRVELVAVARAQRWRA